MTRLALGVLLATTILTGGCAAPTADSDEAQSSEDAIIAKADEHWIYAGPLPALKNVNITVSLAANTARVTGYMPDGAGAPPDLPNIKTRIENGRTRLDIVYPIATAAPPKTDSQPGTYTFHEARPYRPDGNAWTAAEGDHFVTWGGFPFLAYNGGIAFHGPISDNGSSASPDVRTWYLKRGRVSGGCNRMMGEHVVELAHVIGVNMRRIYVANQSYDDPSSAKVTVIADYDMLDDKFIDVDYPTDVGITRPGTVHGSDKVVMFGSWVASEVPGGLDLPPDRKWEGGVPGKPYVFARHARNDMVCSFAKEDLPGLRQLGRAMGALPRSICEKKQCVIDALRAKTNVKASCGL